MPPRPKSHEIRQRGDDNGRTASRLGNTPPHERGADLIQDLSLSYMSIDAEGCIVPKTAEAAVVAAQTYLLTTQPAAGDPRGPIHRAALVGLGLIEKTLGNRGNPRQEGNRNIGNQV